LVVRKTATNRKGRTAGGNNNWPIRQNSNGFADGDDDERERSRLEFLQTRFGFRVRDSEVVNSVFFAHYFASCDFTPFFSLAMIVPILAIG
jgi:hypothetical protein